MIEIYQFLSKGNKISFQWKEEKISQFINQFQNIESRNH